MADLTLSSGSFCRPFRSPWGAFPTVTKTTSTGISSNAIRLGALMKLDDRTSTTTHRVCPTSTTIDQLLVGIAAQTISGSSAANFTEIAIWDANPLVEFKAVTKGATLLSAQVGTGAALAWDSTLNILYVDLGNSSAGDARVLITDLIDNVGDSGGYVAFRFMTESRESTVASSVTYLAGYGR